jgi:hypothetical protein
MATIKDFQLCFNEKYIYIHNKILIQIQGGSWDLLAMEDFLWGESLGGEVTRDHTLKKYTITENKLEHLNLKQIECTERYFMFEFPCIISQYI